MIPAARPLRIVGDVHGDARALGYAVSTDRFVIQLGDIADGAPGTAPDNPGAWRLMLDVLEAGRGLFVLGNHDRKLGRALAGKAVRRDAALDATIDSLDDVLRPRVLEAIRTAPAWLRRGARFFVHGGFHPEMLHAASPPGLGRVTPVLARALFGQTTGLAQADGYPQRVLDWVDAIPTSLAVYCGHDRRSTDGRPVRMTGRAGGTVLFLDTGAGKGGHLSWVDLPA